MENVNRTELSDLGEFGLIEHLSKHIEYNQPSTIKGIGDDCAVIDNGTNFTVVTTDMLVEGVHFDLGYVPLKHLGYKSVVVNVSDIYAMNATPKQITVSVALSNRFSLEAVEELYAGMLKACETYGVDLVGGDTTSSQLGLVISITAIGEVEKDKVVYRSGAKEKDLLMVSGDLGGAYMGLQLLEREKSVFKENPEIQPDLDGHDYILERQLKPEARKDVIEMLAEMGIQPTSMIDVSDGLASEILHLAKASGLGCHLHEDKIPIDPTTFNAAREFDLDPTMCALSGGEDYELLFTIAQSDYDKIKNNPNLTPIGYMMDAASGCQLIDRQNGMHQLTAQGWDALLKK
ncbi:MAG: thiamine-phosphate kinase [Bacteroidota bacterium]